MSFHLYYGGNLVFSISHTAVTLFIVALCILCLAALFATASTALAGPIRLRIDTDLESAEDLEIAERGEWFFSPLCRALLEALMALVPATRTSMSSPVSAMLKVRSPPRSPTADRSTFPPVDPGTLV